MDIETILRMFEMSVKESDVGDPKNKQLFASLIKDECWERLLLLYVAGIIWDTDPMSRKIRLNILRTFLDSELIK